MSCCGNRPRVTLPRVGSAPPPPPAVRPSLAVFRYEGEAPLIVVGHVTQTKYRFAARGAEVAVDIRDRGSVRQVPRLREMRLV